MLHSPNMVEARETPGALQGFEVGDSEIRAFDCHARVSGVQRGWSTTQPPPPPQCAIRSAV